jgi:hypothetical protein
VEANVALPVEAKSALSLEAHIALPVEAKSALSLEAHRR